MITQSTNNKSFTPAMYRSLAKVLFTTGAVKAVAGAILITMHYPFVGNLLIDFALLNAVVCVILRVAARRTPDSVEEPS